jgi:YegS/Rv2252/BmrU family lipid kinase
MKALIIYNPAAGRVPVHYFIQGAVNTLSALGWSVDAAPTQSGAHACELARQAAHAKIDAVFAVGGDGTIGQVAAGLAGSNTALGVLPAGTSNVLGIDLGLAPFGWSNWRALEENIRELVRAPIYSVDVGLCNEKPFLTFAGLGIDAITVQQVEPRLRFEKYLNVPYYAAMTIWNATFWHGMNLRLWADDRQLQGHYILAVVNNIRSYLGGMAKLSPEAHLDDGQMDLWLFSGSNLGDTFRHAFSMMAGRHLSAPDTQCIPFRRLTIEVETPIQVELDGDPFSVERRVEFSILPRSLRLMMPVQSLPLLSHPARVPINLFQHTA